MTLTEVDVSTPSAPKIARTMELAGPARLRAAARRDRPRRRRVLARADRRADDGGPAARGRRDHDALWLPRTTIRSRISRRTFRRSVVGCDDVRRPREFSGLGLVTVLTIDLDKGLFSVDRDAIMAGVQDVYAGPTMLVVASRQWSAAGPDELGFDPTGGRTELHAFDVGGEPQTAYRASGDRAAASCSTSSRCPSTRARCASRRPRRPSTQQGDASESGVSVLRPTAARLQTVGRVTGLGKGERIYAVRFLGDRGYVVTFRQVDPLYTLDLRKATAPKVTGELKITGYSAYLHPISDSLLLGVGQDATEQGRTLGTQVSLFDVGDPARPRLVAKSRGSATRPSAAEQDHHAFLWWAPREPRGAAGRRVRRATAARSPASSASASTTDGVGEVGRISHPSSQEMEHPRSAARSSSATGC